MPWCTVATQFAFGMGLRCASVMEMSGCSRYSSWTKRHSRVSAREWIVDTVGNGAVRARGYASRSAWLCMTSAAAVA